MKITIQEIQRAILRNEKIFKNIALPQVQSGTGKQKESYAFLKASKLHALYFSSISFVKIENKQQSFERMLNNFATL